MPCTHASTRPARAVESVSPGQLRGGFCVMSFRVERGKQHSLGLLHRLGRSQVRLRFGLSLQGRKPNALFELHQTPFAQQRQALQRRLHILVPVALDDLAFWG